MDKEFAQQLINVIVVFTSILILPTIGLVANLWYYAKRGNEIDTKQNEDIEILKKETQDIKNIREDTIKNTNKIDSMKNDYNKLENKFDVTVSKIFGQLDVVEKSINNIDKRTTHIDTELVEMRKMLSQMCKERNS